MRLFCSPLRSVFYCCPRLQSDDKLHYPDSSDSFSRNFLKPQCSPVGWPGQFAASHLRFTLAFLGIETVDRM